LDLKEVEKSKGFLGRIRGDCKEKITLNVKIAQKLKKREVGGNKTPNNFARKFSLPFSTEKEIL